MKMKCHNKNMKVVKEYQDSSVKTKCIVKVWACQECGKRLHMSPAFHLKYL